MNIKKTSIIRLSDTRWNCRYRNCIAVISNYKAIIYTLTNEIENESDKDTNEALGKYKYVVNCQYIHFYYVNWVF